MYQLWSIPSVYILHIKNAKLIEPSEISLINIQNEKGYWVFDLEADTTIPSEYVLLQRFLGREIPGDLKMRFANYLRNRQLDSGGWPLYHEGEANVSTSVKAYFALKQLGDSPDAPHMARARAYVLAQGGDGDLLGAIAFHKLASERAFLIVGIAAQRLILQDPFAIPLDDLIRRGRLAPGGGNVGAGQ